jgi:predicted porin
MSGDIHHAVMSVCVFFLASVSTFGQVTASLPGRATDTTGAVIPAATVTAGNVDTGASRSVITNQSGEYQLRPGEFPAKSTATAFKAADNELANLNVIGIAGLNQVQGREPAPAAPPAATPSASDALTWHGITVYGAYDVGAGWVSHGLPQSPYNYEGSSLVNRNASTSRFLVEPDNLSQTSLGVRGRIQIAHDWFAVFNASTGINPQSGQLANASRTQIDDNGLDRSEYSEAIDGARAGQPFNDEYYGGVSSEKFGTLTFGRQRALGTDVMLQFDPAGGSYAFSYIGYNGTMAGGGDTENTRWDDAVKYKLTFGPAHFGAMGKFADGTAGCYSAAAAAGNTWTAASCEPLTPHNTAYGFDIGAGSKRASGDVVYQRYNQAISIVNPLLGPTSLSSPLSSGYQSTTDSIDQTSITGPNVIDPQNTVYGIVTDNRAIMGAAKYTGEQFKFYVGYEFIRQANPDNPLGVGATDQGGYLMSGVENTNLDSTKLVNIWWAGVKYSYDKKDDITLSFYEQLQNTFRVSSSPTSCVKGEGNMRSSCEGTLNEGSLYLNHHFTTRFDGFAGVADSWVTGGLAIAIPHGPGVPYLHNSNWAPTIGGRFTF